ncbi:MAG: SCO family protein [Actinomycetia bacterium]|nr:SCO family protein [Actinomycetes bacterium]
MGLRLMAMFVALAVSAVGCSSSGTTPTLGELDGVASRPIPTSGVLGTSVADISLPDAANGGEPMSFVGPDGGVLVVYFGYTFCPDVCPTTLSDLRAALGDLGDDADRVKVAMATIDPVRDTDDVITGYLRSFIEDGHPLRTTDDAELQAAAGGFGVEYSVIEGVDGNVEVAHSAFLFAVDESGVIRAVWPFGVEPQTITTELRELLGVGSTNS